MIKCKEKFIFYPFSLKEIIRISLLLISRFSLGINKVVMNMKVNWNFENSYEKLPKLYFKKIKLQEKPSPKLLYLNEDLAQDLGLDAEALRETGVDFLAASKTPEEGSPVAMAYLGHQFGYLAMLGDGRATLIGEQITPSGDRFDLQLKGSGRTPYSRGGDGKAALGPMLREYLMSEAMDALRVPTTRALSLALTGEEVLRENKLQGAVLTRVAASHIRVGSFQYSRYYGSEEEQKAFADYAINRHYPEIKALENPYLEFFKKVAKRQASLIAKWMSIGFVHGVMNTDNMTISGETIDYGPCAFIDTYDPHAVFSSIDRGGRYAYGNQPPIAAWNLARLADSLIPLVDEENDKAIELLNKEISNFSDLFMDFYYGEMTKKLGLENFTEEDKALVDDLLSLLRKYELDYTNTFLDLTFKDFEKEVYGLEDFKNWRENWEGRLHKEGKSEEEIKAFMKDKNPALIPRHYWTDKAIKEAEGGDFALFEEFFEALKNPFSHDSGQEKFKKVPKDMDFVTYCGT